MKFSIIVPVYNVEAFLPKCLDSILSQDYDNFEVLLINDQSPDNSQDIIDQYCKLDHRIIPVNHATNKGLGGARNTGISISSGDYIIFLDSDDWISEQTLSVIFKNATDINFDIIKFGFTEVYEDYSVESPALKKMKHSNGWHLIKEERQEKIFSPICWRSAYRKDFVSGNDIEFPEKLHFEDFSFTLKTHFCAKNILCIPEHLYFYRKDREGSIMNTPSMRDVDVCASLKIISDYVESEDRQSIRSDSEFNYLMYEWSAGTTIYRYLKYKGNDRLKKKIVSELRANKYFRKYLREVAKDPLINRSRKLPVYLMLHNYWLFALLYKMSRRFVS